MQGAQALALLRGRTHATIADVRDLAADVLRHRLVLSYDALADGVRPTRSSTACSRRSAAWRRVPPPAEAA